jgi:hypothetical protein
MVIDDFHVVGVTVNPSKADAPLIVDADAVLAFSAALECFKTVGRRNSQILKREGIAEYAQFATGHRLNIGKQSPGRRSTPDLFRFLAGKVPDHEENITLTVI